MMASRSMHEWAPSGLGCGLKQAIVCDPRSAGLGTLTASGRNEVKVVSQMPQVGSLLHALRDGCNTSWYKCMCLQREICTCVCVCLMSKALCVFRSQHLSGGGVRCGDEQYANTWSASIYIDDSSLVMHAGIGAGVHHRIRTTGHCAGSDSVYDMNLSLNLNLNLLRKCTRVLDGCYAKQTSSCVMGVQQSQKQHPCISRNLLLWLPSI